MHRLVFLAALLLASPAFAQSAGTVTLVGPSTDPHASKISAAALAASINAALASKADAVNGTITGPKLTIQSWTTASRPGSPVLNQIGRNSDTGALELWNGTTWVATGGTTAPSTPVVAPSAPINVQTTSPTTTSFAVTWSASATGTSPVYQVQIGACGANSFANYGAPTSALQTTVSGVQPGTCEAVRVVASNSAGSATSATATRTTLAAAPGAALLSAGSISDTSFTLVAGVPSGTPPITYQPQCYTGATVAFANVGTAQTSSAAVGSTLSFPITGRAASTAYVCQVLASNAAGAVPSSSVTVTTRAAATVIPGAVSGFLANPATSSGISFGWNQPGTGTAPFAYEVDYRKTGASTWITAATGLTSPNYTLQGLAPSTPYDYSVLASNSVGTGARSAVQTFTTIAGADLSAATCNSTQTTAANPALIGPHDCTVTLGGTLAIAGVSISDAGTQCCGQLNITTTYGTAAMSRSGGALAGSGTASWSDSTTLGQVNTDLGTLVYTAPASAGSSVDTLSLEWWAPGGAHNALNIPITLASGSTGATGGGGPAGPGGGGDATGTTALRAQDVWGTFGINTHIDSCCNRSDGHSYGDIPGVISAINFIGNVRLLRDYWESDSMNTVGAQISQQTGAQWITAISEGAATAGFNTDLGRMRSFQSSCKCVFAYDGANEWNSAYSASTAPGLSNTQRMQAAAADQPTLYSAAQADGVKAIQLSSGIIYPDDQSGYRCCGVVGNADYGNGHTYPQGAPEMFGEYNGTIDWIDEEAARLTPGKPVIHTEYGYVHSPDTQFGLVTLANEAIYGVEFIFDAVRHGDAGEIWYGLYDDVAGYFGLFDANNAPYPIATALHNVSTLLGDTASNARTFTPGKLNISFTSLPAGSTSLSGGQYLVMEKSDGSFWVEVGNEQDLGTAGGTTAVAAVSQTVTLGFTATSVKVFDPISGTALSADPTTWPIAKNVDGTTPESWAGVSTFTMALPAHPVLIEIVHP